MLCSGLKLFRIQFSSKHVRMSLWVP